MINAVEVRNFRSLKYIYQPLRQFQVLVGTNASGKTTFLDAISFVSDIVKNGIQDAISKRTTNFDDLTFCGRGGNIEIALEVTLPLKIREQLSERNYSCIRYELQVGKQTSSGEYGILEEAAFLMTDEACKKDNEQLVLEFPSLPLNNQTIMNRKFKSKTFKRVFRKNPIGNDNFYDETKKEAGKGWMPSFKFGIAKSALGNLPADASKFPASSWLKDFLSLGVQVFILDSLTIRRPSPPGQSRLFKTDGSNLPWVIDNLKKQKKRYSQWIEHVRTALPDIEEIDVVQREEDKHKYIRINYANNGKIPSWLVSDGTLRLLALTITAYLPSFEGAYLIEEPENGIHPKALETVYQSLSSVYHAQILLASHSPIILSMVKLPDLLCFAKTTDGTTDIVSGNKHPVLQNWKERMNLSDLFAGGILG